MYIKNKKYLQLIKQAQDRHGFIESSHCDSLLFSGLVGCVPDVKMDIFQAFDQDTGQWHRRPCEHPCFPDHSPSTISKDMLTGLLYYSFYNRRLDISEQIIKHALSNFGIMGQARDKKTLISRCLISPNLLSTAAWISYRLGGPSRPWLRYIPHYESKTTKGFQAHLSVLHALLKEDLTGKSKFKDLYEYHYKRQPNNPLFAIANARSPAAKSILMTSSLWPPDRLPTNADRKEPWLIQRDHGTSWEPQTDKELVVHSGGDWLFLYWLMNKLVNRP